MTFQSVDKILYSLKRQPEWQEWREFEQLSKSWAVAVGGAVSKHARPLSLRDGVLQVATSNAVWAQQLTFERTQILQKLNPKLDRPLKNIRFSCARWYSLPRPVSGLDVSKTPTPSVGERSPFKEGNIPVEEGDRPETDGRVQTSQEAFEQWAQKIKARSRLLPLCPQCDCPTPPIELQRWSICAPCRARQAQKPEVVRRNQCDPTRISGSLSP